MSLRLGPLEVAEIVDLPRFSLPLGTLFPGAEMAARPDWLGEDALSADGRAHLTIRSWLLRLGGLTILVDSCVGAGKPRPRRPEWDRRDGAAWLAALLRHGVAPAEVDIVVCTHLHADHCGWNTRLENGRWVPTFPNARYLAAAEEIAHWQAAAEGAPPDAPANHGAFADSVLPVLEAGLMDPARPGEEIAPGLILTPRPGHTPGQLSLDASHGGGAVFAGDAIHSPVQLRRPDWSSAFDTDPDAARATRRALLEEVAETGKRLIPAHFPAPGWPRIAREGAAFRPVD